MSISIADDHKLFREGLCSAFETVPDFNIISEATCASELLQKVAEYLLELVILDYMMPGGGSIQPLANIKINLTTSGPRLLSLLE